MLIDLKTQIRQDEVTDLLALSVFPDPDRLEEVVRSYEQDEANAFRGLRAEEDGKLLGVIGYRMDSDELQLTIRHMAVSPDERDQGYGRAMVLMALGETIPDTIVAETDEEAVNFFRNIGFTVESLGETYPGVERFKCTYISDPED